MSNTATEVQDIVSAVLAEAQRLRLSDSEVAVLAGVSQPLISAIRRGTLPQRPRVLRGLEALAARAHRVTSRTELGLPA